MTTFNLAAELMQLQEGDVQYASDNVDNVDVGTMDADDAEAFFSSLVYDIQSDPHALASPAVFDKAKALLVAFPVVNTRLCHSIVDLLANAFLDLLASTAQSIDANEQHNFDTLRILLLQYSFLTHWLVEASETRWKVVVQQIEKEEATAKYAAGKTKGRSKSIRNTSWSWSSQRRNVLKALSRATKLHLTRLIVSDPERDTLVSMYAKDVSLMIEDPTTVSDEESREFAISVLCDIADKYEAKPDRPSTKQSKSLSGVQARILNDFLNEEHLAEFGADVLTSLINDYENVQPFENVLMMSAYKVFAEKDLKTSKAFARFLTKISEQVPRETLKQMVHLQVHVDSVSYTIRLAMIEVIGNIIQNYLAMDTSESAVATLHTLYDILEERFRDNSSYVRGKVLQVIGKLATYRDDLGPGTNNKVSNVPVNRSLQILKLVLSRLHDKTSNVRRAAIKLLSVFISNSPFLLVHTDEGKLSLKHFLARKAELEVLIRSHKLSAEKTVDTDDAALINDENEMPEADGEGENLTKKRKPVVDEDSPFTENLSNKHSEEPVDDDDDGIEYSQFTAEMKASLASEDVFRNLRTFFKYYTDGIDFLTQIENSIDSILELLGSSVKSEVIEIMNFFVTAHEYSVDCAMVGLLKMSHKVWDKDTGENERLSVRDHLLLCYGKVFFSNDLPFEEIRINAPMIASNLIQLVMTMSMAEQTSLERIVGLLVEKDRFPTPVIDALWKIFVAKREYSQRRLGAIRLLGMIGKVKKSVVAMDLNSLMKVGLGSLGLKDLTLAKYSCIALQQLGSIQREKGVVGREETIERLSAEHPIFQRIIGLMLYPTNSSQWFSFAQQGINAIYSIAEHPDMLAEILLRKLFETCFWEESQDVDGDNEEIETDVPLSQRLGSQDLSSKHPSLIAVDKCDSLKLSKLCFAIGHVAVKQIVHLEAIEMEWKQRKFSEDKKRHEKETIVKTTATKKKKRSSKNQSKVSDEEEDQEVDELDNVIGTAEDDVVDYIQSIRDRELLYGEHSILAMLAPLVVHICTNNSMFRNQTLQSMAVLSLCKLMCVSADFCETHLQLLFTILERTPSPIIRTNIIIGLGDMTICFNSLIDQNISYLYRRLSDPVDDVKKNALMVLTFLILNGMVKVKGHLSEMAKCLVDEDRRISDWAKLFFNELATKDNEIYNNLPDIISNLSHGASGVEEGEFKEIMNFLLVLVKKDRQTESLVDKLCQRFKTAETERQSRDIGLCLASLQYNSEKAVKRVLEHIAVFEHKLHDATLRRYMLDLVGKARKVCKDDVLRKRVEEFAGRLEAAAGSEQ